MSFFYIIQKNSKIHRDLIDAEIMYRYWKNSNIQRAICEFLQVDDLKGMGLKANPRGLYLGIPPSHLRDQFVKTTDEGVYVAKNGLNNLWIKLCRDHGLEEIDLWHPLLNYIFVEWGCGKKTLYHFGKTFFLESANQLRYEFLEEITEVEFSRLQSVSFRKEHLRATA
jgi:hypothetical protein